MSYQVSDQTVEEFEEWRYEFLRRYGKEPTRHEAWEEATRRERARLKDAETAAHNERQAGTE